MPYRVAALLAVLALVGAVGVAASASALSGVAAAHPEPGDVDGDTVRDELDNCPTTPNGSQVNTDSAAGAPAGTVADAQGDACDADDDGDGIADDPDNCRIVFNPDQANADGDAFGDACPPVDDDQDTVVDPEDNCRPSLRRDPFPATTANPDQKDFDGDDVGDVCDRDYDNDRYDDYGGLDKRFDNCPTVYNPDQADADKDGIGTACDPEEALAPSATPPPGGGGGPGAIAADTHAPRLRLTIARKLDRDDGPFVVPISCSEGCALEATLEVDARTARKLRLGSKRAVLAKGSWALGGAARTYVFCDWQRAGKRALKRSRSFSARVVVKARDLAGNISTARKTVTLAAPARD